MVKLKTQRLVLLGSSKLQKLQLQYLKIRNITKIPNKMKVIVLNYITLATYFGKFVFVTFFRLTDVNLVVFAVLG